MPPRRGSCSRCSPAYRRRHPSRRGISGRQSHWWCRRCRGWVGSLPSRSLPAWGQPPGRAGCCAIPSGGGGGGGTHTHTREVACTRARVKRPGKRRRDGETKRRRETGTNAGWPQRSFSCLIGVVCRADDVFACSLTGIRASFWVGEASATLPYYYVGGCNAGVTLEGPTTCTPPIPAHIAHAAPPPHMPNPLYGSRNATGIPASQQEAAPFPFSHQRDAATIVQHALIHECLQLAGGVGRHTR